MDRMAIIRSLSATAPNGHSDAEVMTGLSEVESPRAQHPCMGSVISRLRGPSANGVPPYVTMRKMSFPTATPLPTMLFYLQPGFLGRAHLPLSLSGSVENLWKGPAVQDLQLPASVDRDRLAGRKQLLTAFDDLRRDLDASGTMSGIDSFQSRALEIVTSSTLRNALDVSKEPPAVQEHTVPLGDTTARASSCCWPGVWSRPASDLWRWPWVTGTRTGPPTCWASPRCATSSVRRWIRACRP